MEGCCCETDRYSAAFLKEMAVRRTLVGIELLPYGKVGRHQKMDPPFLVVPPEEEVFKKEADIILSIDHR